MRRLACIAIGAMHAACSSSSATPDAMTADARPGGLTIELLASGGVPQTSSSGVVIERVTLGVRNLRAIGDAAPGDLRTTRTDLEFDWHDNQTAVPYLLPMAPPGVYSTIDLQIADSATLPAALVVAGRVARGGDLVPFEIRSLTADIPIQVAVHAELPPRAIVVTSIEVDVASFVADIDWDALPLTGEGRLAIADGDPDMTTVISHVATAFAAQP